MVVDPDLGNLENPVHIFNIPLYGRIEVFCRTDSARIQRASKCTGQSPRDAGDHMIECGGVLRPADPAAANRVTPPPPRILSDLAAGRRARCFEMLFLVNAQR